MPFEKRHKDHSFHEELHRGHAFSADLYGTASGGSLNALLCAGSLKNLDLTFGTTCESEAILIVVESPTTIGNRGTAKTPTQRNRTLSNASDAVFRTGAVFAEGSGTTLGIYYIAAGSGPHAGGGDTGDREDFLFSSGTTYGFKLNQAGNDQLSIDLIWAEVVV